MNTGRYLKHTMLVSHEYRQGTQRNQCHLADKQKLMLDSLFSQRQPPSPRGEAGESTQLSQKFTQINQSPGLYHKSMVFREVICDAMLQRVAC
eukprot:1149362-Pelagomonas_calceolata.AAC.3